MKYKDILKKSLIITTIFTSFTTPFIANANFKQVSELSKIEYQNEQDNYFNHNWKFVANSIDGSIVRYSADFIHLADVNDSNSFVTYISGEIPENQITPITQAFSTHLLMQMEDIKYLVTMEQFDVKNKSHRTEMLLLFGRDGKLLYKNNNYTQYQKLKNTNIPSPHILIFNLLNTKEIYEDIKNKPWYNSNTKKFVPVANNL